MYDVIIGRSQKDQKAIGTYGSVLIAKHYVKMGQTTSLSNNIYLDVTNSHVLFICGKRGSGKSYSMGVIAEGIATMEKEISQNISVIMLDTMGIYWTMKYPNEQDKELLKQWKMEGKGLNVKIFTPKGYYESYKEKGIPTDHPFSVKPGELDASDWCMTFEISLNDPAGVFIERIISHMKEDNRDYDIGEIISNIRADNKADPHIKEAVENRFLSAKSWGLFSKEGTGLNELVMGGQITVLDVSCYATMPGAQNIRALVIGLVSEKLFIQRMIARKFEEYSMIRKQVHFMEEDTEKKKEPLVWLVIDEAHEFLPNEGKTTATRPLITILREGRQPGISLILASQQPGKIHTDVMTQSDILISHRITARMDIDALGMLMQSYMREGLDTALNNLPREKGSALVLDDANERLYPMRIRPRFTHHGGSSPSALKKDQTKGIVFDDIEDL